MSKNKEIIRDQFLAALKQFDPSTPWIKPWVSICSIVNASTGRPYSGINILMLSIRAMDLGVEGGGWLTYNQAKQLGGTVSKGQKGTKVVFYKPITKNKGTDDEYTYLLMKTYTVFHTAQCEDLDEAKLKLPQLPETTGTMREDIEALIESIDIRVETGHSRAAYSPTSDVVMMPNPTDFFAYDDYYRTLFHEYVHATGHPSRLKRELATRLDKQAYAFEELVAEMGSVLLGTQFGLQALDEQHNEHVQQHAAYINGWITLLEDDAQALFDAWNLASAAVDWLLNPAEEEQLAA